MARREAQPAAPICGTIACQPNAASPNTRHRLPGRWSRVNSDDKAFRHCIHEPTTSPAHACRGICAACPRSDLSERGVTPNALGSRVHRFHEEISLYEPSSALLDAKGKLCPPVALRVRHKRIYTHARSVQPCVAVPIDACTTNHRSGIIDRRGEMCRAWAWHRAVWWSTPPLPLEAGGMRPLASDNSQQPFRRPLIPAARGISAPGR